jgi:hypothetical protein
VAFELPAERASPLAIERRGFDLDHHHLIVVDGPVRPLQSRQQQLRTQSSALAASE